MSGGVCRWSNSLRRWSQRFDLPDLQTLQQNFRKRKTMKIGVPKEIRNEESRVAATPETVKKLVTAKHGVVESGALSSVPDEAYLAAGATIGGAGDAFGARRTSRTVVSCSTPTVRTATALTGHPPTSASTCAGYASVTPRRRTRCFRRQYSTAARTRACRRGKSSSPRTSSPRSRASSTASRNPNNRSYKKPVAFSPCKRRGCAPLAGRGAWRKQPPTLSTASSRECRCASGWVLSFPIPLRTLFAALVMFFPGTTLAADEAEHTKNPAAVMELPEIEVIGTTPLPGVGLPLKQVPSNVQVSSSRDIGKQKALRTYP